jgi:hypothetical protein
MHEGDPARHTMADSINYRTTTLAVSDVSESLVRVRE